MLTLNSGAKVKVTHRLAPAELIHEGKASEMHMSLKAPHDSARHSLAIREGGYLGATICRIRNVA